MHRHRFENSGKTGGLLLRMLWAYHHTGRYVVLDSGFCVLKAIIDLQKAGVYSAALIKKQSTGQRVFLGRRCSFISTRRGYKSVTVMPFRACWRG
jgi:hypothetical protein